MNQWPTPAMPHGSLYSSLRLMCIRREIIFLEASFLILSGTKLQESLVMLIRIDVSFERVL